MKETTQQWHYRRARVHHWRGKKFCIAKVCGYSEFTWYDSESAPPDGFAWWGEPSLEAVAEGMLGRLTTSP